MAWLAVYGEELRLNAHGNKGLADIRHHGVLDERRDKRDERSDVKTPAGAGDAWGFDSAVENLTGWRDSDTA